MTATTNLITPYAIQVGQWIQFHTDEDLIDQWIQSRTNEDLEDLSEEEKSDEALSKKYEELKGIYIENLLKGIYKENQIYLVFSKDTRLSDVQYHLIDINGKIVEYIPRVGLLNLQLLLDGKKISIVSKETLKNSYDHEKIDAVYTKAKLYINKHSDFFNEIKTLNS